jgi:hypothetical protein
MANIILEFIGQTDGAQIFRHPTTKRNIRAGRNLAVRYVGVEQEEVNYFVSLGLFRVAHSTNAVSAPTRKDAPVRIEPVVTQQVQSESINTPIDETPSENVVSFDASQVDQLVDWLSDGVTTDVAITEKSADVVTEVIEDTADIVDEPKSDKVRRGRPRS